MEAAGFAPEQRFPSDPAKSRDKDIAEGDQPCDIKTKADTSQEVVKSVARYGCES
jgi:hypothetical protein